MGIAVLVVSLPERRSLLYQALDGVAAQTLQPEATLVGIDPRVAGEAANMNRLANAASSEWLALLHDDDLWFPDHLDELTTHSEGADVVVANFELVGRPNIEPHHCNYEDLRRTNWFAPSMVMMKAEWFDKVGGFTEEPRGRWVDWTMWKRLLNAGARFACSHKVTVQYRFGEWNKGRSWSG